MKLELKHLASYLPYKLQAIENNKITETGLSNFISFWQFSKFKPILRPLSDLTEEIEVNGKHFIPCYHWDHSNTEQDTYCDRIINVASDPSSVEYLDYFIVEKLFEWHFDIFGLIDAGLAVDINTFMIVSSTIINFRIDVDFEGSEVDMVYKEGAHRSNFCPPMLSDMTKIKIDKKQP